MSLRNKVFALCNTLKDIDETNTLRQLMYNIHVSQDDNVESINSGFGYLSRHGHNQFYGYLFTDENVEAYKQATIFKALTPLNAEDRKLMEKGQATIDLFIDGCLSDIVHKYPNMRRALNPYSKYKPIRKPTESPYLSEEALAGCIAAFKNSPAYRELITSPIATALENISEQDYMRIMVMLSKEIAEKSPGDVSEDIENLLLRYNHTTKSSAMILFRNYCLMLSIKEMLRVCCQLLFTALLGGDLIVLNNDNIINIEANCSTVVNKYMAVLTQEVSPVTLYDIMGSVVLIDCDPFDGYHIHEFGQIHAETFSFNQDTGSTTKFTFVILDEHLNPLHNLIS